MASKSEMKASKKNSWKWLKKEEKKVKRLKEELANEKAEIINTLKALEELHLTVIQIREVIRPLLPPDSPDAQLAGAFLAQNNGD